VKPEDKYLTVNNLRLHYLDWGNKGRQAMLLLHGFTAHAHSWDDFAIACHDHYNILALDQRGHGDSEWAKDAAYTAEDFLIDITGFADTMKLDKLVLIGHSMGGRNAIIYSGSYPDKVDCLVIIDSRPQSDPIGAVAIKLMANALLDELNSVEQGVQALRTFFPHIPQKLAYDLVFYGVRELPNGKLTPKFDRAMKAQAQQESLLITDLWPYMEQIKCPTLIIRGADSPVLPLDIAQKMVEAIPNSQLVEIEGAGHLVPQENPIAFENAVRRFLET